MEVKATQQVPLHLSAGQVAQLRSRFRRINVFRAHNHNIPIKRHIQLHQITFRLTRDIRDSQHKLITLTVNQHGHTTTDTPPQKDLATRLMVCLNRATSTTTICGCPPKLLSFSSSHHIGILSLLNISLHRVTQFLSKSTP